MKKIYKKPYRFQWSRLYMGYSKVYDNQSSYHTHTYMNEKGFVHISINIVREKQSTEFETIWKGQLYRMFLTVAEYNERSLKLYAANFLKKVQSDGWRQIG
jgi:hypothetical protein